MAMLALAGGCANLAPLPELPPAPAAAPVTVVGAGGKPLPAATQRRVDRALLAADEDGALRAHLAAMEAISEEPLIAGNAVRLLVDGPATYAAMFAAIEAAREQVAIEMYIFDEARHQGRLLSDLLVSRAAAGVGVRVLYDAVGSMSTPREFLDRLAAGGVVTCAFNPLPPKRRGRTRLTQRDHRKMLIVDGATGFTGGINFSGTYTSGSALARRRRVPAVEDGWRDTNVEVRGPAVARMQSLFAASWEKHQCPGPDGAPGGAGAWPTPREPPAVGTTLVRLDASSTDSRRNETYLAALSAVQAAQRSIDLTMAYFSPDARIEQALVDAARRGVRVRLLLPGVLDFRGILHAGRAHYARLLAAGIGIHEEPRALLHAKTLSIDGVMSTVGSANWDYLSFALNDELNLVVLDRDFADRMRALFEADLEHAVRIDPDAWARRPLRQKLLQRFWLTWERLL